MANIAAGTTGTTPATQVGFHYANPSNPTETDSWRITGPAGLDVTGRLGAPTSGWMVSIASETAMFTTATVTVPVSATQTSGYNVSINSHRQTGSPFDYFNEYAATFVVIAPTVTMPAAPAAPTTTGPPTGSCAGPIAVLSWGAVPGADTYTVRKDGAVVASGLTALTYTATGLTLGQAYSFTVTATNTAGTSAQSVPLVVTPCSPPAGETPGTPWTLTPGTTLPPAAPTPTPAAPSPWLEVCSGTAQSWIIDTPGD